MHLFISFFVTDFVRKRFFIYFFRKGGGERWFVNNMRILEGCTGAPFPSLPDLDLSESLALIKRKAVLNSFKIHK